MPIPGTPPRNGKHTTVRSEALLTEKKNATQKGTFSVITLAFAVTKNYSKNLLSQKRAKEDFAIGGIVDFAMAVKLSKLLTSLKTQLVSFDFRCLNHLPRLIYLHCSIHLTILTVFFLTRNVQIN